MAEKKKKDVKRFEAEIAGITTLRDLNKYLVEIKGDLAKLPKKDSDEVHGILRAKRESVPHIERVSCSEFIKHILTKEEINEVSATMAQSQIDLEEAESQKKAAASKFDGIIKNSKLSISQNARMFRDGYDMRYVDCEKVKDFNKKFVTYVRNDTSEIIKERPMTTDEMQMSLPIDLV